MNTFQLEILRLLRIVAFLVIASGCVEEQDKIRNSVNALRAVDGIEILTSYDGDGSLYFQEYDQGFPNSRTIKHSVDTIEISSNSDALQGVEHHLPRLGDVNFVVLSVSSSDDFVPYIEFIRRLQRVQTIILAFDPLGDEANIDLGILTSVSEFDCLSLARVQNFSRVSVPTLRSVTNLCLLDCKVVDEWLRIYLQRNPQLERLILKKTCISAATKERIFSDHPLLTIEESE